MLNGKVCEFGIEISEGRILEISEDNGLSFDEVKFLSSLAITEEDLLYIVGIVKDVGIGAKEYIRSILG